MTEPNSAAADLLVSDARLLATVDEQGRELAGGWLAITDGLISGIGASTDPQPAASRVISAQDCLVTPGLVNTHHHLYQNLTRAYGPMTSAPLFEWLQELYPLWTANLDEEAVHVAAWVGLAELALSGCTTSSDHHYIHPAGAGDLLAAEIAAAHRLTSVTMYRAPKLHRANRAPPTGRQSRRSRPWGQAGARPGRQHWSQY